jgi:hypothetical protein
MLAEIESAIAKILELGDLGLKKVEVRSKGSIPAKPAAFPACDSGTFKKVSQNTWACEVSVSILVLFENFQNEEKRRQGMSIIIMGIFHKLANSTLGLDIKALQPVRFRDVTTEAIAAAGQLLFDLEFSTSFELRKTDTDQADDLLRIGMNYYLQDPADDHVADAGDLVQLNN